jgi:hypothetical protein
MVFRQGLYMPSAVLETTKDFKLFYSCISMTFGTFVNYQHACCSLKYDVSTPLTASSLKYHDIFIKLPTAALRNFQNIPPFYQQLTKFSR